MAASRKVIIVTGLPLRSEDEARRLVRSIIEERLDDSESPSLIGDITIVPSCLAANDTLNALVDFDNGLPEFFAPMTKDPFKERQVDIRDLPDDICFDAHFHGFTQLYPVQGVVEPIMDIIAVTGVDGHAYGSWQGRGELRRMWLRHWLQRDMPKCRTMIYGYKAKLDSHGSGSLEIYTSELLELLDGIRDSEQARHRPIVFIGHSFGGLIIARAMIKAMQARDRSDPTRAALHRATYGIMFFAVPHLGLDVQDMRQYSLAFSGSTPPLIDDMDVSSISQLRVRLEDFLESVRDKPIVSFYEAERTRRLKKNENGLWERSGEFHQRVGSESAILHLPSHMETPFPVFSDHSMIVKLDSRQSGLYQVIQRKLKSFESSAASKVQSVSVSTSHRERPYIQSSETAKDLLLFEDHMAPTSRCETICGAIFRALDVHGKKVVFPEDLAIRCKDLFKLGDRHLDIFLNPNSRKLKPMSAGNRLWWLDRWFEYSYKMWELEYIVLPFRDNPSRTHVSIDGLTRERLEQRMSCLTHFGIRQLILIWFLSCYREDLIQEMNGLLHTLNLQSYGPFELSMLPPQSFVNTGPAVLMFAYRTGKAEEQLSPEMRRCEQHLFVDP